MDSKNIFTITLMILLITKITIGKPFNDCQQSNNNNLQGKCVYLTKCQNLFQLILRGNLSESEKNYLRDSQCGVNNGQPLVCCQQENIQLEIIPQILRRQSESLFPYPGICGTQTTSRIVGGSKTSIGEFPWTALIKYRNRYNHITFHCAGALINSRYVLTAAHCIVGTELAKTWKPVEVRLGEWNLKTDVDCIIDGLDYECADPHVDIKIQQIIVHESYIPTSPNQYNDIALIRLMDEVKYTEFIRPICLPFSNDLRKRDWSQLKYFVTGWGRTEHASQSDVKQKLIIAGFDAQQCSSQYKSERIFITSNQLCAGGTTGKDSCSGDSGAPLMTIDSSLEDLPPYWFLAGVVSFGPKPCGLSGWPGVYTKVSEYIEWIEAHVKY